MPYSFKGTSDTLAVDVNNNSLVAGIGISSFNASQNVNISINTSGANTATGVNNTFLGYAGVANTGSFNSFFGSFCGVTNTSGANNTFVGQNSGRQNSTGGSNTFIGTAAGKNNQIGNYNTFVGFQAGLNTISDDNSFFGVNAGLTNSTGTSNVFFGEISGFFNTTGSANTFIGLKAGYNNTTGSNNTIIGSLNFDVTATTGNNNTLIGTGLAGYGNITGTVIISDGANTKNIVADSASFRTTAPVRPPQYTVALLPVASTAGVGAVAFATNGRNAAEAASAGTGCPVYSNGGTWKCFYNSLTVTA